MKFYITVHLKSSEQEVFLQRCYASIRRVYPDAPIVLVVSSTSLPLRGVYDATVRANPGLSTIGALYLAGQEPDDVPVVVLHDSMVVLRELPTLPSTLDICPLYHFRGRLCIEHYPIAEMILQHQYVDFLQQYTTGWLGNAAIVRPEGARRLVTPGLVRQVRTNLWFQAMERILPVRSSLLGLRSGPSVCGDIFAAEANPWTHPERSGASLDSLLALPFPILKTVGGRIDVIPGQEEDQ